MGIYSTVLGAKPKILEPWATEPQLVIFPVFSIYLVFLMVTNIKYANKILHFDNIV